MQIKLYNTNLLSTYISGTFSGTATQISVAVSPNTTYNWRIRSKCGSSITAWSPKQVFTTPAFRTINPENNSDLIDLHLDENDKLESEPVSGNTDMNIFPNPASNSATVTYSTYHDGKILLQLMDFTGKVIINEYYPLSEGINKYPLNLMNLSKGVFMVIINDNGTLSTRKIVVN